MIIPQEVRSIINKLKAAGYEAYIVGGCVRDLLLKKNPQDWDITTNAKPEDIQAVFPDSFYENKFLTVTVRTENATIPEVEITTYRFEAAYSDQRHPDEVRFAKTLEDDLSRRDFTMNALAMDDAGNIIDLFNGETDLKKKIIRAVRDPNERFSEDALRMMRAARLATVLGFSIEPQTFQAIKKHAASIMAVSQERIRDELVKIIMADRAADGIELLRQLDLLKYILPELQENYGVGQNKHHSYDCYTHALKALEYTAQKNFSLTVRLASLLHDVGKPRVKRGQGIDSTFYNHEVVGANMANELLNRLKFSKKEIEKIVTLVRYHLFYYNVDEVSESSVRRLVKNVGPENMEDLLKVRQADRIGSGVPKAEPYKLRHLKYVIDKVSQDPIAVTMLAVDGKDIMKALDIQPGPKVGILLDILLGYVLEDPKKNNCDWLIAEIKRLGNLPQSQLQQMANEAKKQRAGVETKRDEMTKQKYWVS